MNWVSLFSTLSKALQAIANLAGTLWSAWVSHRAEKQARELDRLQVNEVHRKEEERRYVEAAKKRLAQHKTEVPTKLDYEKRNDLENLWCGGLWC